MKRAAVAMAIISALLFLIILVMLTAGHFGLGNGDASSELEQNAAVSSNIEKETASVPETEPQMTVPAFNSTEEKALFILENVVDLNVSAYNITASASEEGSILGLPPEKRVDFTFESNQGNRLRVICYFINDSLHRMSIVECRGPLVLNHPTASVVDMAEDFLGRYQSFTGDSFYGELRSMLNEVRDGENAAKIAGNVKLEVSFNDYGGVEFSWKYTDQQGISAQLKNIVLSYDDGRLKTFINNWPFYRIGGEPVVSKEEAIAIAVNASESYSYTITNADGVSETVSGFRVASIGEPSLCYLNAMEAEFARGGDPFVLFPEWYVPLGFEGQYPGGVSGMTVRVWADTAEVSSIGHMKAPLPG